MYDDEEDGGARRRETLARFERLTGARVVLNPHAAVELIEALLPQTAAVKEQLQFARYYEQNDGLVTRRLVGYSASMPTATLRAVGRAWVWEDVK